MRLAVGVVVLAVVVVACGGDGGPEVPVVDRPVAPEAEARPLTLEEAGLIASGELSAIYGAAADPVPVRVEGEVVELDGQRVWRLDLRLDVGVGGARTQERWRMWVGTPADGPPAVLRVQRGS